MQPLSATQAISPALRHTSDLLLAPRRWRLLLKIGAVAVCAQLGGSSFNLRSPSSSHLPKLPPEFLSVLVTFIVLAVVVGLAISLLLFYLGSRLQFVLFDVVLRRDTTVGPIWPRFGRATWPWIGLKLLFYVVMLLCALPLVLPFVLKFIKLMHSGGMNHINFFALLPTIFAAGALFLIFLLVFTACYFLLYDFGLPSMALEATPIGVTAQRVFALLRAETGQVLLYLLMRFILGFVGVLAAEIGLAIGTLIALIPLGGLGAGLWFGLHTAGVAGYAIMICGWVVLGLIFLVLFFIALFMVLGYVYTFLQAYAIYFLAGRYPLMGEILTHYTPPPPGYLPPYTPPTPYIPPPPLA